MGFENFAAAPAVKRRAFWLWALGIGDRYWDQLLFDGFSFGSDDEASRSSRAPFVQFDVLRILNSYEEEVGWSAPPTQPQVSHTYYPRYKADGTPDERFNPTYRNTTQSCLLRFSGQSILERWIYAASKQDERYLEERFNWLLAARDGVDLDVVFDQFQSLQRKFEDAIKEAAVIEKRLEHVYGQLETADQIPNNTLLANPSLREKRDSLVGEKTQLEAELARLKKMSASADADLDTLRGATQLALKVQAAINLLEAPGDVSQADPSQKLRKRPEKRSATSSGEAISSVEFDDVLDELFEGDGTIYSTSPISRAEYRVPSPGAGTWSTLRKETAGKARMGCGALLIASAVITGVTNPSISGEGEFGAIIWGGMLLIWGAVKYYSSSRSR